MEAAQSLNSFFTNDFFSKMAHHSRSPFNGLLGFSELLLINQEKLKGEEANEYLLRINMQAKKAYLCSENVILLLKLLTDNIKISVAPVNFSQVLEQAFGINKEAFILKNVEFNTKVQKDLTINSDLILITNVISNMILKSMKLAGDNTVVDLTTKNLSKNIEIKLAFTGLPIESVIVRDFFTDKNNTKEMFPPELDIELWICSKLAKLLGFSFNVQFSGDSTTFILII